MMLRVILTALELDDNRYSMIMGYLMANNITINGVDGADNDHPYA